MKTLSIFARGALVASLVSAAAVPQLANGPQDTYCACNQVEKQLQQLQQQLEALNIRTTAQIQALEEKTQRLEHALQLGLRDATAHVPPKVLNFARVFLLCHSLTLHLAPRTLPLQRES
jgi:TolA-binding protein